MKKIAIVVAAVATLVLSGCSTTASKLFGEDVPDTAEVITTPLESAVIVQYDIDVTE